MGELLKARMKALAPQIPLGMDFGVIAMQADAVQTSVQGFIVSLLQAIAIVVVVLLFFMGLRSGLLIGFVLFLTICGSFIFMSAMGVTLERISLGALIIALGMLVDNAIVVVDGMLIRFQQGMDKRKAAIEVVKQTAIPLLGATIIAVLAFAAMVALHRRATIGGSWLVRTSLAGAGEWFRGLGRFTSAEYQHLPPELPGDALQPLLMEHNSPWGRITHLAPAAQLSETPGRWARPAAPRGTHPPVWPQRE